MFEYFVYLGVHYMPDQVVVNCNHEGRQENKKTEVVFIDSCQ